jgi:hypothetical protein
MMVRTGQNDAGRLSVAFVPLRAAGDNCCSACRFGEQSEVIERSAAGHRGIVFEDRGNERVVTILLARSALFLIVGRSAQDPICAPVPYNCGWVQSQVIFASDVGAR